MHFEITSAILNIIARVIPVFVITNLILINVYAIIFMYDER